MPLYNRLKEYRARLGVNQQEMGRLTGETFGSALTFGAASKASAPGQVGVHELKQVLDIIHSSL